MRYLIILMALMLALTGCDQLPTDALTTVNQTGVATSADPTTTATTAAIEPTEAMTDPAPTVATSLPTEVEQPQPGAYEGMVFIPEGSFIRGASDEEIDRAVQLCLGEAGSDSDLCFREFFTDAQPVQEVFESDFYIDEYEVTNREYEECVAAGICSQPSDITFYEDTAYNNHPVVYVTWNQATTYCTFVGKRLPAESEWEKAATWNATDEISLVWPFGNEFVEGRTNVLATGFGGTTNVTAFEADESPYGVYNMTGDVSEWVSDWYTADYENRATSDPTGPEVPPFDETLKVARGGSFQSLIAYARGAHRFDVQRDASAEWLGFRCAADTPEQEAATSTPVPSPTPRATETTEGTTEPTDEPTPTP